MTGHISLSPHLRNVFTLTIPSNCSDTNGKSRKEVVDKIWAELVGDKAALSLEDFLVWTVDAPLAQVRP